LHRQKRLNHDLRVILFDIDGTLLRGSRRGEYREMIGRMLVEIFGTEGKLQEVDFSGRTDLSIYREALECAGIPASLIRSRLHMLEAGSVEIVRRMSASGEVFHLCTGVRELLEALAQTRSFVPSLLTGNLERLALIKLQSAGIGHYFPIRGAYGSDAEDRNQLPGIAAQRVFEQLGEKIPPHRMLIVGDTPRDIACARHFGARVLAVASGFHSMAQLHEHQPDALLPDLGRTDEVLRLFSAL
jgi:phosphoglycolate phosphatase